MGGRSPGSAVVQAWLHDFAERALHPPEVDGFVHSVDTEILAAIPEIAEDPVLVEDLHASTRAHWRNFLVGLSDEHRLALPPAAVALSLSIARRHLDINVLLKVYRVANKSVFRYVTAHTAAEGLPPGLPRDDALITLWLRAEQWIDESIEQLIDHYAQERASLAEGARARRGEIVEALLSGAPPTSEAEQLLGHRLGLWQTAFVLSASPSAADDVALFDVASRVCQKVDLPRPLTTLAGSRELWAWIATAEQPTPDWDQAVDLLAPQGLHLAVGMPCRGPHAFRTSHLQALAAQHIGLRVDAPFHAYADVELPGLVGDGELARAMVQRELGPLLDPGRAGQALRATVLAYLRCGLVVDAAAQVLFVHPNTVRYRIARVEELLGHRIAERAGLLEISLRWAELYGLE